MKVLFIEPCHVGFGGYFRALNITQSLSQKKIHVDLLCASKNPFQFTIRKTKLNDHAMQYELPRFAFHFFFNGRILRGIIATVFGLIRQYDIIHSAATIQLESNIPAVVLKLLGKRVVIDWDDYWEGSPIYQNMTVLKKYVTWCERVAPRYFKHVVVVSSFLETLARERGATHVLKLINGVNTEQFVLHSRDESRKTLKLTPMGIYFLSFGNTFSYERTLLLFETFEAILTLIPDAILLINDDPTQMIEKYHLQETINRKILSRIHTVGTIPQDELGYYLAAANAVIFLQGDSDNERACFPIRVGSFINGEAVIITNDTDSEVSRTLKKYRCAIMDNDSKRLARKVKQAVLDKKSMNTLRSHVKEAKEALRWDKTITKLINYYQEVR